MEREVTKSPVIYFKTKKYKAFLNPQERIERENIKNIQREQIVREETDYYTVQTFKKNVENYINNGKNN